MPSRRTDRAMRNKITKYPVIPHTKSASNGRTMPVRTKDIASTMGVLSIISDDALVPASASVSSCAEAALVKILLKARGKLSRFLFVWGVVVDVIGVGDAKSRSVSTT